MTIEISKATVQFATEFVGVTISKATVQFVTVADAIAISKATVQFVLEGGEAPPGASGRRRNFMSFSP